MRPGLLLLLSLAAPALTLAVLPAQFQDFKDYLINGAPNAVVVEDVNNDGIPDAVVATSAGTDILLGRGDGTFKPPHKAGKYSELAVAVADFNNDGKLDIAATILTNGTQVTLALGNGDGTFQPSQLLPISCTDCYLAAADFNQDGKLDLAVAGTNSVTVYLGNGDGTFNGGQPSYSTNFTVAVLAGKINRDAMPDLIVTDMGAKTITVLLGNGDGSFRRTDYPTAASPYFAVLADLNGDGLKDLAYVERDADMVGVRLNKGGGVFGAPARFAAGCSPFSAQDCVLEGLAAGDFNHDGKIDLATPGAILHGNGDGTFQAPAGFYAAASPWQVASGDFNHDGHADLLVANESAFTVTVLLGNATSVRQPVIVPAGSKPKAVATGDFNGDGKGDLAVAAYGDNAVHILLGAGNGKFTSAPDLAVRQPGAVLALDLNHDGKLDLAIASDDGLAIYLGNGDGTFTAGAQDSSFNLGDCTANAFQSNAAPCLVAADFNGDGIPDLAGGLWINGTVSFLIGNGDGTFRSGTQSLTVNDTPQGLAAGDFNHDGKMDLVVSGDFGSITVFPGNGDGTFGTPLSFNAGTTGCGVAVGDVDGDGNLDVVLAGSSGGSTVSLGVWVALGKGDLTFQKPVALQADQSPNGVLLADLNNDGRLDIASANILGDDVSVFTNQGGFKFTRATDYGAGGSPAVLAAVDLNGDHHLTVVVVDQAGDLVLMLP